MAGDAPPRLRSLLLLTVEELAAQPGVRLLRTRHTTTVLEMTVEGRGMYLKKYHPRGPKDRLLAALGVVRAKRAAVGSAVLAEAGFAVPRVLAVGWRRTPREEFVVTEGVPGPLLEEVLRGRAPFPEGISPARLASALGREVGRMHAAGVIHGDLNVYNLLLAEEHGGLMFVFLDVERARRRPVTLVRAARELADLNAPVLPLAGGRGRMRFLAAYLRERPGLDGRRFLAAVARATERRHGGSR